MDADKDNYWNYRERLMTLFKVGGIVIYDNTLWGGTVAMAERAGSGDFEKYQATKLEP